MSSHKDDVAKVKKAFQTLLTYMRNVARSPDEEKFRKIRLNNPTFQERVGNFNGGIEFLEVCGFEKIDGVSFCFCLGRRLIWQSSTLLDRSSTLPFPIHSLECSEWGRRIILFLDFFSHSTWGQFFRNAELEKMLDQDLSRLYPEHCRYFQTTACQAMLRRILLLWCVRHPEYAYRQGMHELVAPLLFVVHVDLHYLSQVQGQYGVYFSDEFDETPSPSKDLISNYRFSKTTTTDARTDDEGFQESKALGSLDELDSCTRDMYLLSDAYEAEGELGIIISESFMEHDAYCMFENLMNGAHRVVAMADFFSPSPAIGSNTGVPPVIEASSALYHLLSVVDSPLHCHLVDIGVESQYFALRWLRVLFGREFSLDGLLGIWDELFYSPNSKCIVDSIDYSFRILCYWLCHHRSTCRV